ncbi:MAG TPA: response regulator, partial [Acidobacteriota bacterium]|nr:response regulator [Acidobacteriota bacterium]
MKEKTILFVDDDAEMRRLIHEFFHAEGYHITEAVNGREALEELSNSDFDVVITDLRMQEMDGLQLLKEIHLQDPRLPVILITAFGTIETAVEAVKEGATNFIPKPFKMQTLKTIVDKAIELKRITDENQMLKGELLERYSFHNI